MFPQCQESTHRCFSGTSEARGLRERIVFDAVRNKEGRHGQLGRHLVTLWQSGSGTMCDHVGPLEQCQSQPLYWLRLCLRCTPLTISCRGRFSPNSTTENMCLPASFEGCGNLTGFACIHHLLSGNLEYGLKMRTIASTNMNQNSSRSHVTWQMKER